MKKILLFTTLLQLFSVNAQNIFRDNFSSYTTGTPLSGQGPWSNNSSNPGGLGAAVAGGSASNVTATPITYLNYGTSANAIEIKPNADGCGTSFSPVTSGELYVGFVLNLTAAQANNNSDFFRVMSNDNFTTSFRLYAVNTGFGFNLGVAKGANGNPIAFTPSSLNYNENHLIVIRYTQSAGTNDDVVSVYVDSEYITGQPASATMSTFAGNDQAGSIDRMAFRQNWTNGMPTGKAGLVSVANTWTDLGFEPLATQQFNKGTEMIVNADLGKQGSFDIQLQQAIQNATLAIFSANGNEVSRQSLSLEAGNNIINVRPMQSGLYIFEITTADNSRLVRKAVVR